MPVQTLLSVALSLAGLPAASNVRAADAAGLVAGYASQAGAPPDSSRDGRHASTGKSIAPLAPAFNPARFTDPAKVEKWFRRNCNDVVGRECSAAEKADVLAWLITLKP